jgi:hypothetical protein
MLANMGEIMEVMQEGQSGYPQKLPQKRGVKIMSDRQQINWAWKLDV